MDHTNEKKAVSIQTSSFTPTVAPPQYISLEAANRAGRDWQESWQWNSDGLIMPN